MSIHNQLRLLAISHAKEYNIPVHIALLLLAKGIELSASYVADPVKVITRR